MVKKEMGTSRAKTAGTRTSRAKKKITPLHRLFGLGLTDLFSDMNFRVELEKDLSLKRQMLDAIIIEKEASEPGSSAPDELPDGLEDLGHHTS